MQMSSFGSLQMSVIPKESDKSTYELVIAAENRKDLIRMDIQKNETIDQFCKRLQSMLRGLMSAEVRSPEQPAPTAAPAPAKSFEEIKAALTGQKPSAPVRA